MFFYYIMASDYYTALTGMKRERDADEGKTIVRRMGMATNKRRHFMDQGPTRGEISRIYKKIKMAAPLHMLSQNVVDFTTPILSTTSIFFDIHSNIVEGDNFANRHGTVTRTKRLLVDFMVIPGTTQAVPVPIRYGLIRAQAGSTLANTVINTIVSANPIANNNITQLFRDKLDLVCPTILTAAYPTRIRLNVKFGSSGFRTNYSGSAAGTQSGETLFFYAISNVATGTAAPAISGGHMEVWFQP